MKRDNVIFALTHHGGHLGYFEGGIILPNSVTWLDRIVVEFSTALLQCKMTDLQQHEMSASTGNSCVNHELSTKRLISASDDSDDDSNDDDDGIIGPQQRKMQEVQSSTSPTSASSAAEPENKLAAEMVAEILRVSASRMCTDTSSVLPRASKVKSGKINHKM